MADLDYTIGNGAKLKMIDLGGGYYTFQVVTVNANGTFNTVDALGNQMIRAYAAQDKSYVTFGTAYGAYATPTDLIVINGAANKLVRVANIALLVVATAAILATISFIKRSVANTLGTSTTPTPTPLDSADGAAAAVVKLYSAAPTLGAGIEIARQTANIAASTAAPTGFNLTVAGQAASALSLQKPVILRGAAESLAINFGGAALPVGFSAFWLVTHTEEDI